MTIQAVAHHRMLVVLTTVVEFDLRLSHDTLDSTERQWLFMPLDSLELNYCRAE